MFYLCYTDLFTYNSKTTSVTCGAGTAIPSGAHEFTPGFSEVRVARSFVFCVMFCRSLFVFLSFLAHLAQRGHVRYCHHLASVVRPLTFSHFNLL
jgi:hypothetical protein